MDYEINGSIKNYKMEVSLITPTPAHLITRKKPYWIFYETYSINLNSSDGTDQECNTGKTFSFPSELTLVILVNANWSFLRLTWWLWGNNLKPTGDSGDISSLIWFFTFLQVVYICLTRNKLLWGENAFQSTWFSETLTSFMDQGWLWQCCK